MTIRKQGLVATVAVLLTGLAACSASSTAPRAMPEPHSQSPTASPSLTVQARVEAAVRHYFDVANRALASGDTRELESLSLPGCGCRKLVRLVKSRWAEGGRIADARIHLADIRVHDIYGSTAAAEVSGRVSAYRVTDAHGRVTESSSGGPIHNDLSLVQKGKRWLVAESVDLR